MNVQRARSELAQELSLEKQPPEQTILSAIKKAVGDDVWDCDEKTIVRNGVFYSINVNEIRFSLEFFSTTIEEISKEESLEQMNECQIQNVHKALKLVFTSCAIYKNNQLNTFHYDKELAPMAAFMGCLARFMQDKDNAYQHLLGFEDAKAFEGFIDETLKKEPGLRSEVTAVLSELADKVSDKAVLSAVIKDLSPLEGYIKDRKIQPSKSGAIAEQLGASSIYQQGKELIGYSKEQKVQAAKKLLALLQVSEEQRTGLASLDENDVGALTQAGSRLLSAVAATFSKAGINAKVSELLVNLIPQQEKVAAPV